MKRNKDAQFKNRIGPGESSPGLFFLSGVLGMDVPCPCRALGNTTAEGRHSPPSAGKTSSRLAGGPPTLLSRVGARTRRPQKALFCV